MNEEFAAAVKITPAIGGATYYTLTLNDWVAIVTIVYVVAQTLLLLPKYWAVFRRRFGREGVK